MFHFPKQFFVDIISSFKWYKVKFRSQEKLSSVTSFQWKSNNGNGNQWKLSSSAAHGYYKTSHLEACSLWHNYDLICLSETWLESSISSQSQVFALK